MNWRALLYIPLVLALVPALEAQSRRRPPSTSYAPIGVPDQAEGAKILEASRNIGFGSTYYLEFRLRVLPRTGRETRMDGRWYGSLNVSGPITRVEIAGGADTPETEILLVQGGPRPAVWRSTGEGDVIAVDGGEAFAPIAGTTISAADLQTPFMYWTDFTYEGMVRFRGRPTHVFLLYPPSDQEALYPEIGGVRSFIDTEFSALSQVQWVDEDGEPLKTITAGSVRKVPGTDRWIVTQFDVRDEKTRNKTQLRIEAAALEIPLPGELFLPVEPLKPAEVSIPEADLRRFE